MADFCENILGFASQAHFLRLYLLSEVLIGCFARVLWTRYKTGQNRRFLTKIHVFFALSGENIVFKRVFYLNIVPIWVNCHINELNLGILNSCTLNLIFRYKVWHFIGEFFCDFCVFWHKNGIKWQYLFCSGDLFIKFYEKCILCS